MSSPSYDMHLIMNTHWDREFRWSFPETQVRLMEAGDILVDTMEKDKRFTFFHPDSQASFLDDYLELRPERTERVKKLVTEGRILAGPWYTLPAAFLVSGEALVRNLLTGHRIARNLGGVMKCAYNIFSWGQVAQLPQIYRQFGMDTIMFYRGIDQGNLDKLEFWWDAPDGTRALGITFGEYHRLNFWAFVYRDYLNGPGKGMTQLESAQKEGGYRFNSHNVNDYLINQPCRRDIESALQGLEKLIASVKDRSSTHHLGFFQGFDLENPDPVVMDLVDELNARISCGKIRISSLPEYVRAVREALTAKGLLDKLDVMKGEMLAVERSGDPFAPLYAGVFSARMPLKQQNSRCQRLLENGAEPAATMALMDGGEYPKVILDRAWKLILQNQQHDGIGGVHIDRVTTAMEERNRDSADFSKVVTENSFKHIVTKIDYSHIKEKEIGLTVFNTTAAKRSEVLTVELDVPVEWGMSYLGMAHMAGLRYQDQLTVDVYDADGIKLAHQVLHREERVKCAYLKYGSHINFEASRLLVALDVKDIPAFGYATFRVVPVARADRPVASLSPVFGTLENEHLKAVIAADGTIALTHKQTGRSFPGLHVFEDAADKGGPLIFDTPMGNIAYRSRGCVVNVEKTLDGPLHAEYRIDYVWTLPEAVESELKVRVPNGQELCEHGALRRSERVRELRISSRVALGRGAQVLTFDTTVNNTVKDHRLRVLFPTGLSAAQHVHADSAFDISKREIAIPDSTGWYESALRTWPVQSFIDVNHGGVGLAVLQEGLSEYEVIDDAERAIALTLLRCLGTAGAPFEAYESQPLAQCQGVQRFRYALYPHTGDHLQANVPRQARNFTVPLRVATGTGHAGSLPRRRSYLDIDQEAFQVTCLKLAEDGKSIILRGYNPGRSELPVTVTSAQPLRSVAKVTLEETTVLAPVQVSGGNRFSLTVKPGEIASCAIALA
jgi:hypothetical protein